MQRENNVFYGEFITTPEEALNFKPTKIVVFDDSNHPTPEKTKAQLFYVKHVYHSFAEESDYASRYKKVVLIMHTACEDNNTYIIRSLQRRIKSEKYQSYFNGNIQQIHWTS
ncbi:unnamed protein product [Urochloa humidicola]